jgi:hypothetical protein
MRGGPRNLPWGTVAKRTSVVTAIFNRAVKKALSCQSLRGPESLQPGTPPARVRYITVEKAEKVIAGWPFDRTEDLGRHGAVCRLRCPSCRRFSRSFGSRTASALGRC